jgi:hypothetical protein
VEMETDHGRLCLSSSILECVLFAKHCARSTQLEQRALPPGACNLKSKEVTDSPLPAPLAILEWPLSQEQTRVMDVAKILTFNSVFHCFPFSRMFPPMS